MRIMRMEAIAPVISDAIELTIRLVLCPGELRCSENNHFQSLL